MSDKDLSGRLRSTAIFQTSTHKDASRALIEAACRIELHPADAASALVEAAARILIKNLEPEVVAAVIQSTMREALGLLSQAEPTADTIGGAGNVIH